MRRVHVIASGRVQAVGYRYAAVRQASRLGLTGWIRNRGDGTIEAEVEGDPTNVGTMLEWMGEGPRSAEVTGIDVREIEPIGPDAPNSTDRFDIAEDA